MISPSRVAVLAVASLAAFLVLGAGGQVGRMPEPTPPGEPGLDQRDGYVDGRASMVVLPTAGPHVAVWGERYPEEFGNPAGFEVHLIPESDQNKEYLYLSGQWFQPPVGLYYRGWLESDHLISPYSFLFQYTGDAPDRLGRILVHDVVPSGRVVLPPGQEKQTAGTLLRLLSLAWQGETQPELSRRLHASSVGDGVPMPAGLTLASLWSSNNEMLALSRPFAVVPGISNSPNFAPAAPGKTHLVVLLEWAGARNPDPVVDLKIGGAAIAPAVQYPVANRVYLVWYDLPAGEATISAEAADGRLLPPTALSLREGKLHRQILTLAEP